MEVVVRNLASLGRQPVAGKMCGGRNLAFDSVVVLVVELAVALEVANSAAALEGV